MVITSKRGNLDNVVTFEHICDTREDMNDIDPRQINLGSVCIVIKGEDGGLEIYIADSDKMWHPIAVGSGGNEQYINLNSIIENLSNKVSIEEYQEIINGKDLNNISNEEKIIIINNLINKINNSVSESTYGNFKLKNNEITLTPSNFSIKNAEEIYIPDCITELGPGLFSSNIILKKIEGKNIYRINAGCFSEDSNLQTISFSDNLYWIGDGCFYNCQSLDFNDLFLSAGENKDIYIGQSAFFNCYGLKNLYISKKNTEQIKQGSILQTAFNNCSNLETIDIDGLQTINSQSFYNCINLKKVIIRGDHVSFNTEIFKNCTELKYVYLPKTTRGIQQNIFGGAPITCKLRCGFSEGTFENVPNSLGFNGNPVDLDIRYNVTLEEALAEIEELGL